MTRTAIAFALVSMVTWGVWAVLVKLATRSLLPETTMIISYITGLVFVVPYVALSGKTVSLSPRGVVLAVLAGIMGTAGVVALYAGLARGSASLVTTISALYFVVAVVLGVVVFGETLGARELAGIGFGVVAILLLST